MSKKNPKKSLSLVYAQDNGPKEVKIEELPYIYVTEFNDASVIDFYRKFLQMLHDPKIVTIPVVISSFGGQAHSLLAMLDIIEASTKPVATIAMGKAMSCGVFLLAAGTPGLRYAAPNTDIMIHEVSNMEWGKITDMKNGTAHTNDLNNLVFHLMAGQAKKKDKDFFIKELKKRSNVDWYVTAKEAKALGIVDHVALPNITTN